jgi:hypothetical protein
VKRREFVRELERSGCALPFEGVWIARVRLVDQVPHGFAIGVDSAEMNKSPHAGRGSRVESNAAQFRMLLELRIRHAN